jgi:hypothetical protein
MTSTPYSITGTNVQGGGEPQMVGASASESIGFWGATPITQPSGASQTALAASQTTKTTTQLRAELTAVKTLLAKIRLDLKTAGIIKGAA